MEHRIKRRHHQEALADKIEVFDVRVRSTQRLQLVDSQGLDVVNSPAYLQKLRQLRLIQTESGHNEPDQVYDLSDDLKPAEYDMTDPNYVQEHLLRFEI